MARISGFRARQAFSVITDSAASTRNVQLTVPKGWDDFWDVLDASGHGLAITEANGGSAIAFNRVSYTAATRTLVLNIEAAPTPSAAPRCVLYWIYYDPTGAAVDLSVAVATTTQLVAAMDVGAPNPTAIYQVTPQQPGSGTPAQVLAKGSDAEIFVWLDFSRELQRGVSPINGSFAYEEAAVAAVSVVDSSAVVVGSMTATSDMRWVTVRNGASETVYLKLRVQAGTDGQRYTLIGEYTTTIPGTVSYRNIPHRIGIDVRDQLISPATATAGHGWAGYADDTHTVGSPQAFAATTRTQWTVDAGTVDESMWSGGSPIWASDAIVPDQLGTAYMVRIMFTFDPASAGTTIRVDLDVGSDPYAASSVLMLEDSFSTAGGSGPQTIIKSYPIHTNANLLANGGRIALTCSTNSNVYNKTITIYRIY